MRVWNLADIWQHWDGKGGGLYKTIDKTVCITFLLGSDLLGFGRRGCRVRLVGLRQ